MSITDQELLARIGDRQDSDALSNLYDRYSRLVYGLLLKLLHDTDEAEDALQEVFLLIWNKASTYREELGSAKNWLVRIAHNRGINIIRSRRMREKQQEIPILEEADTEGRQNVIRLSGENLWETEIRKEEGVHVSNALKQLPEDQRILIDMAFFQGYSHSEIAEETALPLGTVKTRIRSGMQTLRSKLDFMKDETSGIS